MNGVAQVPGDSYEPFRRCTGYQGLHINTHTDLNHVIWSKYLKNQTRDADQKRKHERERDRERDNIYNITITYCV